MDHAIGGRLGVKAKREHPHRAEDAAMIPGATRLGLSGTRMMLDGLG
jgi:deoxyribose-phosphate aldolase